MLFPHREGKKLTYCLSMELGGHEFTSGDPDDLARITRDFRLIKSTGFWV